MYIQFPNMKYEMLWFLPLDKRNTNSFPALKVTSDQLSDPAQLLWLPPQWPFPPSKLPVIPLSDPAQMLSLSGWRFSLSKLPVIPLSDPAKLLWLPRWRFQPSNQ